MSYLIKREYQIIPNESFPILWNCSGCQGKNIYVNTNSFRINANGNNLDIWLIYQCSKCKHTLNLPIYERIHPREIKQEEYNRFLANDRELAFQYGTNLQFMKKNKVEVDWRKVDYRIVSTQNIQNTQTIHEEDAGRIQEKNTENILGTQEILISNSFHLRLRTEKVLSEILHKSRQEIQRMMKSKELLFEDKLVSNRTTVYLSSQELSSGILSQEQKTHTE